MKPRTLLPLLAALAALPASAAESPGRITALYHVGYWVRDIGKSRAFYETYLGFAEPYILNTPAGALQLVVIKVNDGQSIYLFPNPSKILPNGDNLDHLGLVTDDAAALRDKLAARGVHASPVSRLRVGDLDFGIGDPDGCHYEVTQFEPDGQLERHRGQGLPRTRVAARLRSATIAVSNLGASLAFYRDRLGFRVTWPPGELGAAPGEVELEVPDGTSGVVLRPVATRVGGPAPRAVPEFCLEVDDVPATAAILRDRALAGGFPPPAPVTPGLGGGRETSCVDPDGTLVVFADQPR